MLRATAIILWLAVPAWAGVEEAIDTHVLPATARFAQATADLAASAAADCRPAALRTPFQAAFDAWLGVSHLRLGPLEEEGRALAIGFWPDTRGMVPTTVARLVEDEDPALFEPEEFAEVSVAGRGLFAMEHVLFDEAFAEYPADGAACALVRAQAADLARMAAAIDGEWRDGYADKLRTAGSAGNTDFLSQREAQQAIYTALVTGLEFTKDQRLGRPLGSFDRPRPLRAEARRSGRSLRNVLLSLEALRDLAGALAIDDIPLTEAAFERALGTAGELDDPTFAGVEDPQGRFEVEILQQQVDAVQAAVAGEIGTSLGLAAGFNASDGD